jgi:peptidyl-prolyl cis-trans isomerase A (cyclophilin A)
MKKIIPMALAAVFIAASLWGQTESKPAPTPSPQPDAALLNPSALQEQAPATYKVKFTTTKGGFYNLVKHHFYDGAAFFRVISGFMAQFGISAWPEVSRVWQSATIPDDHVTQSNTRGTLTFATAGPNTRTTQVFINYGDNSNLNGMGFSPFGKVIEGMKVVDKLYSGYGEGAPSGHGPSQGRIQSEGKAYLEKNFPKLDTITTAVIVP